MSTLQNGEYFCLLKMSVVFILLIASLSVAIGFLIAFIWSVRSGQFEDDYTPAVRMLFEEDTLRVPDGSAGNAEKGPDRMKSRATGVNNPRKEAKMDRNRMGHPERGQF
jgi:cbb3-type cytochrome oxidase maturation protein